ncbi:MAG TPA: sigma-70 family RNA polymerase sigma factor [Drouetiella sp.]
MGLDDSLYLAIRGDSNAQQDAFSKLRGQLLRAMLPKLKTMFEVNDSFVEDVVQDTMIVVMQKLDTFRGDSSFFTWVCSIAVRQAMAEMRRKRWKDYSLDALSTEDAFEPPASPDDFTERVATKEILDVVKVSISTALTDKQRTALLAELDGLTTDEIARRYDTTRGAIYKLTHDARRALIKDLHKRGFELEAMLERTT